MLFNSLHFLIFYPVVATLYFFLPYRYRWALLLAASYYFYMCWRLQYVLLLILATLIDYWAGLKMGALADRRERRKYVFISNLSNLGLLFFFKYFSFFNESMRHTAAHLHLTYGFPVYHILLPVGISFHTFQGLSYSIDVYRGVRKPERHLGIFALFIAFFPQMVAGPIERAGNLIPQFYEKFDFDYRRVTDGLKLMAWGFFKKLVIADSLAPVVDRVFQRPHSFAPVDLLLATYYFAFQIYCDFSGYTDIARGAAQVMGIHLIHNFNRPYFSRSIPEFWKRWHISLSTWFRDYVYIPLGGNRVSTGRWSFNIVMTFLLSGLWHGANWTYVVWGGLHGFYYWFSVTTQPFRKRWVRLIGLDNAPGLLRLVNIAVTFHLVLLGWIFFRAGTISDALYIVHSLAVYTVTIATHLTNLYRGNPLLKHQAITPVEICALGAIAGMELLHGLQGPRSARDILSEKPSWVRWPCYVALVLTILVCSQLDNRQFIYFQF